MLRRKQAHHHFLKPTGLERYAKSRCHQARERQHSKSNRLAPALPSFNSAAERRTTQQAPGAYGNFGQCVSSSMSRLPYNQPSIGCGFIRTFDDNPAVPQWRLNSSRISCPEIMFANDNLLDNTFVAVPLMADDMVDADDGAFAATSLVCFFLALSFFFSAPAVFEIDKVVGRCD